MYVPHSLATQTFRFRSVRWRSAFDLNTTLWRLKPGLHYAQSPYQDDPILYHTILYYTILYYTILYYTILYYTILYYTILYYTILYYISAKIA